MRISPRRGAFSRKVHLHEAPHLRPWPGSGWRSRRPAGGSRRCGGVCRGMPRPPRWATWGRGARANPPGRVFPPFPTCLKIPLWPQFSPIEQNEVEVGKPGQKKANSGKKRFLLDTPDGLCVHVTDANPIPKSKNAYDAHRGAFKKMHPPLLGPV